MLCQLCNQREATVYFTRVINNQKIEMFVCKQCAEKNAHLKLSLNKLLSGMIEVEFSPDYLNHEVELKACPECGMTLAEFNRTGKMGCSTCYKVFRASIEVLLKRVHGNVRHHGKMPKKVFERYNTEKEIALLKESLQRCIEREEYEKAAELRDKIRELENNEVK